MSAWSRFASAVRRVSRSFYAKLSALFLVLIIGLGIVLGSLGVQAAGATQEANQKSPGR